MSIQELINRYFPNGRTFIAVRNCQICGSAIGYRYLGENLYFDGNCHCLPYLSPLRQRDWSEAPLPVPPLTTHLTTPPTTRPTLMTEEEMSAMDACEDALHEFGFDDERFDVEEMAFDYRHNNVDLTQIEEVLEYSKRRIVLRSIINGQKNQAREQCQRYGLVYAEVARTVKDMESCL